MTKIWNSIAWSLAALLLILATHRATAQPPQLDLAKWNQAVKLSVSGFTADDHPKWVGYSSTCQRTGFDSDPVKAQLNDCFYNGSISAAYSYWVKTEGNLRCNSNAYCYALDTYKDGFCAPGSSDGTDLEMGTADRITCTLLIKALIADGAKQVNKSDLGREPSKGHYIAAMARPSDCNPFTCWTTDFNMARKDSNGYWSWKMPAGPASNRDLYDNLIMDIQNATLPAHYDDFCGYFLVNNNTMTVGGSFGSDYFPELTNSTVRQQYSTSPGVTASVVPLAYNETTDGAFDADSLREQAQDRLWRSKKGMPEWDEFYAGLSENSPSPSISEDGNTGFSTTGSSNVVGTGTNVGTGSSSRTGNEGVVTPSTFGRKMLRNAS
eukprot:GHRR01003237.1.p1 GENE.GHRR01003237.1~~GHRR01003237.1.p1  ORF type:complete len:380 (+),score=103.03 GHRR01003237.1:188-1327(+)